MNATARLKDGVLDVWSPQPVADLHAPALCRCGRLEQDKVNVHTTFLGGGFGRRGEMDFSIYAALLAKETDGRPVKVIWTREEDIRHDAYRPAAAGKFRARLGDDGMPVALDMKIAVTVGHRQHLAPHCSRRSRRSVPTRPSPRARTTSPIRSPIYRVTAIRGAVSMPVGFWRSVGNSLQRLLP